MRLFLDLPPKLKAPKFLLNKVFQDAIAKLIYFLIVVFGFFRLAVEILFFLHTDLKHKNWLLLDKVWFLCWLQRCLLFELSLFDFESNLL